MGHGVAGQAIAHQARPLSVDVSMRQLAGRFSVHSAVTLDAIFSEGGEFRREVEQLVEGTHDLIEDECLQKFMDGAELLADKYEAALVQRYRTPSFIPRGHLRGALEHVRQLAEDFRAIFPEEHASQDARVFSLIRLGHCRDHRPC